MSSLSYWERRKAQRMFDYMQSAEDTADDIAKLYQKSSGYISHELDKIFERYKRKHHLTNAEAYRLLNEIKDKTSLDELKQALRAPGRGQTAADILAELESPAFQARLERLQQLQNQIDLTMQQIYKQEKVRSTSHYVDLANEAYYKSIFDIQQRVELGFSFAVIDHKAIDRVINSKWSGSNYSDRIWHNTRALAQDLKQELLINMVTGRTDSEVADIISNKYAQGASNARRLVRTESCNLANQMEMQSYEDCGIETYIYVATLDLKTSTVCRKLDGKRFKVSEQQPGLNCPPMHPWCRSTTICDISDDELSQMQRRARNPATGRVETVPANMTYEQWHNKYVKGNKEAEEKEKELKRRKKK
ncbi:minor capsid protein [Enterocloster citroniae]|uniref:minor capsid protein n=1 Tax=Enterocloster citroniae TaxID=358743 RepID=UPI0034A1FCCF